MRNRSPESKTVDELGEVPLSLIPAGINGMIERIVAAHPEVHRPDHRNGRRDATAGIQGEIRQHCSSYYH